MASEGRAKALSTGLRIAVGNKRRCCSPTCCPASLAASPSVVVPGVVDTGCGDIGAVGVCMLFATSCGVCAAPKGETANMGEGATLTPSSTVKAEKAYERAPSRSSRTCPC